MRRESVTTDSRLGVAHGLRVWDLILYLYFVYALLYDASGTYQPL
jgi:hypothetical protein